MHNYAFPLSPLPAVKNKAKQKQGVTIKKHLLSSSSQSL